MTKKMTLDQAVFEIEKNKSLSFDEALGIYTDVYPELRNDPDFNENSTVWLDNDPKVIEIDNKIGDVVYKDVAELFAVYKAGKLGKSTKIPQNLLLNDFFKTVLPSEKLAMEAVRAREHPISKDYHPPSTSFYSVSKGKTIDGMVYQAHLSSSFSYATVQKPETIKRTADRLKNYELLEWLVSKLERNTLLQDMQGFKTGKGQQRSPVDHVFPYIKGVIGTAISYERSKLRGTKTSPHSRLMRGIKRSIELERGEIWKERLDDVLKIGGFDPRVVEIAEGMRPLLSYTENCGRQSTPRALKSRPQSVR